MRIVAGVLIIIVAILDLLSGFGYAFVGGATAGLGAAAQNIAQKDPAVKEAETAASAARATGGALALFGFFLLAMAGLTIACGVVLFMAKAPTFALAIGVLQILAELIGMFLTMGGAIVWQIPGLVAGILVIIAALSYRSRPTAVAPM